MILLSHVEDQYQRFFHVNKEKKRIILPKNLGLKILSYNYKNIFHVH